MVDKVIGLTVVRAASATARSRAQTAQRRVFDLFPWLTVRSHEVDQATHLTLWGLGRLHSAIAVATA